MRRVVTFLLAMVIICSISMPVQAGTYEKITVSNTPVKFNTTILNKLSGYDANSYCCAETAAVRYKTGGTVSATEGLPVAAGVCFTVKSRADMGGFNVIRSGSVDATLHCEHYSQ